MTHHRLVPRGTLLGAAATALLALALPAQAQTALDDVMAKKVRTAAVPTDAAPYGFVCVDHQPQGSTSGSRASSPTSSA